MKKAPIISHEDAAASLVSSLRAYTAFHYLARCVAGETVLILNGASGYGHIAVRERDIDRKRER